MRHLVTGGTGFVGSHVVDALLARGDAVTCLVRDPAKLRWLAGRDVRLATGDTSKGEGLAAALEGCEGVIHVAGVIKARDENGFREGNAGGVRNILEACAGAKREFRSVVVVTSLAAMGPVEEGKLTREHDERKPVSAYGRSKAEAEDVAREYAKKLPVVVARPPMVYGPRDEAVLEIFRIVSWWVKPVIVGEQRLSLVHVRDLAAGLLAAADRGKAGRSYFLAHRETMTARELANRVENALGVLALGVRVPPFFLHLAARMAEMVLREGMLNRDKAREMCAPGWACDVTEAGQLLGWEARIGHSEGLFETARWYRAAGWIS